MKVLGYTINVACTIALFLQLSSCRGWTSSEPPIDVNPNMDLQPKYKPFRESDWFADKRDMRPLVDGVIARGHLKDDAAFYSGIDSEGLVKGFPGQTVVNREFVQRGQQRFSIYCAACHDQAGYGGGLVGKRMMVKPASLHLERLLVVPNGYIFNVITNGMATMPALGSVVSVKDRWAIIAYVRALQISQDADLEFEWNR